MLSLVSVQFSVGDGRGSGKKKRVIFSTAKNNI